MPAAHPGVPAVVHVALAGNPNAGKTSIFNNLTGGRQRVANYPGVTVETKEGLRRHGGVTYRIVDLPGAYSLTANSPEELIAREYILRERPDVVVQVVDASNLERGLYMTIQFLELGVRLVLALNMIDEARARGLRIDTALLGERLGAEVVETVGNRGIGTDALLAAIERARTRPPRPPEGRYPAELAALAAEVRRQVEALGAAKYPAHWAAIKFLEGDREVRQWLAAAADGRATQFESATRRADQLARRTGESIEAQLAEARYGAVAGIYHEAVRRDLSPRRRMEISERIDAIVLNRYAGFPIFLLIMFALFQFTFTLGEPLMNGIEAAFGWLAGAIAAHLAPGPLRSLLLDGIIGGVGGVLVFVPNIVLLFVAIGLLEKSGYMARAAFIMDRIMHRIGLHGRSFIPMITGFGCSVPAIMATRTLEHERDRLATMMVVPLMSCSARLPIYTLLIPAFFPLRWRGFMFFLIYAIGVVLAIVMVKVLRVTVLAGESTPFVMELPPYRWPTARSVVADGWEKSVLYLRKAGTIVLAISILLWTATSYPVPTRHAVDASRLTASLSPAELARARAAEDIAYSLAGRTGRAMAVVFQPLGFDWKVCTALIGALGAKEVFVAQLGIVNSVGEDAPSVSDLHGVLAHDYTPLQGFCIMLFCLVAAPCMATVAATRRESNGWKWALLQFGGLTALAYVVTLAVFQLGMWWGIGV
ncbi:MAG: ferrous iron transport protein B [bacterium]|nr:ferrous iron transport protein B [bacterium]